jgi:hypothetical protein
MCENARNLLMHLIDREQSFAFCFTIATARSRFNRRTNPQPRSS